MKSKSNTKKKYITKDSGKRLIFKSGMNRDIEDDKPRYDLIDLDFLEDLANLMARGAKKYGVDNWRKANSIEELKRFKASAWRHLVQYMQGDNSEAHHSAVCFNLAAIEMLRKKLKVDIHGRK